MASLNNKTNEENEGTQSGWLRYAVYVIKTLEDLVKRLDKQADAISSIKLEFEKFKTKIETSAAIISTVIGLIVTIVNIVLMILFK